MLLTFPIVISIILFQSVLFRWIRFQVGSTKLMKGPMNKKLTENPINWIPQIEWRKAMTNVIISAVMSPEAESQRMGGMTPTTFSMATRLDTLNNKTVYLVDTGFCGSFKFMKQLQKWFAEHMPEVTTIRKRKTGFVFMDDTTDLWDEVKAKGHAAVLGVAG